MKYRSKLICSLLVILLFNLFIINVSASDELILNNVEDGVLYLDLDDNKSKTITIDSDEYEVYSCHQNYGNILSLDYQSGGCVLTAKKYGINLVTVNLAKKNYSTGDLISKQIVVNVDFDNYITQILNNIPNEINAKIYSNSFSKFINDYIPEGINYSGENCKTEGEYQYCDFKLSYSYPKEITENYSYVWEYVTKSKKIRFLTFETDLPYISSYIMDLGDEIYLNLTIPSNINPDDLMFISTNNTVASIEDDYIVAKSPGKAEIRLYNKKSLEYNSGTIEVRQPKLKDFDELVNYFKDRIIDIDASTYRYYGDTKDIYKALAMQYFNNTISLLPNRLYAHATNASCNENKCKVEFMYHDNGEKRRTTEEFTINYKGISADDYITMSVWNDQNIYTHNLNFNLFLDEDDDFSILIDDEYLNLKIENYCFDSTGMSVVCDSEQEDLTKRNTSYYLIAKKTGDTKVQIISNKGYMKEINVYITHTEDEIKVLQNYFDNLNSIALPYQSIEFTNNLNYLEEIIKNEIENNISYSPLYQYLDLDVECTFYNKCNIKARLEKKSDNNYGNMHISELSDKIVHINYDILNNNNVITNLINEAKKITNTSLTLDDTIYLENTYDNQEFYENLIYKTNIPGIINDSTFDISFELIDTNELNNNIKGNSIYRIYFRYDNKVIFKKDITVYSNHFITMPPKEKSTTEAKINYIKTYVDNLLETDVIVEHISDNTFKVVNNAKTLYLILDKKEITQIQYVHMQNNLINLSIGDTYKIQYNKYPTFANTGEITFESEDENVAIVDSDGIITAVNEGYTHVYARVNHSASSMWVLVNKDMQTIINEKINNIETNLVVLYSDIYNDDLNSAISSAIWNKNHNELNGFNVVITEENDKHYAHLEVYTNIGTISSNKKEINFELKGIKVNSKDIEMNTGETYDLGLSFTEGDINNLLFDYENKDVVTITNDGKITALKPGYSYIYINDKFNKYHNYTKVIVDKDIYYNELITKLKNETINISSSYYYDETLTLNEFESIVTQIFNNKLYEYISFYIFNKSYDTECDVESNTCTIKVYEENELLEEITLNIELSGIFLDGKIKEISLNEEYEPVYKIYPENSDVSIESLDTNICRIENNKIKGINAGICPIKYTSNNKYIYQLIVVDKNSIINSIKNNFDSVNNNLTVNQDHYVSPYIEGEIYKDEWAEYDSLYNAQIYHEVENRMDVPYEVYFYSNLDSLETNPYEINLKMYAYYQFEKDNTYLSVDLIDGYTRTFNVDYTGISEEDLALGEEVRNNIKDTYHLNLLQTLRFKMDGAPGMRLYEYSSIEEDINAVCPNCTYLFDNYTGGGGGDIDMMSMGGSMVILKDGIPIGAKSSGFEVRFGIEMDVIESVDDVIEAIRDKVREAYLEIRDLIPFTYSFRSNLFSTPINIPEPDIEVTRERDEETHDIYYNIKVEDIEFRANVDIKTTNDAVYTREVTEIKVNKDVVNLKLGESENISYEVLPTNATDKNVKWTTSNSTVAVYENGKIIAKGVGNAVITITAHNNVKKTINVNVTLPINTNVKKGDINLDGKINMTDLIKLRQQQAGLENLNTEALINADINNDGKVNMTDIIKLRKYFAGLEDIK